jgi:hypothetical protein
MERIQSLFVKLPPVDLGQPFSQTSVLKEVVKATPPLENKRNTSNDHIPSSNNVEGRVGLVVMIPKQSRVSEDWKTAFQKQQNFFSQDQQTS